MADPQTEPRQALPTTPAVVIRLKRESDISHERKEKEDKDNTEGDTRGTQIEHTPRSNLTSPPFRRISLRRLLNVENSLAFGREMLPAFNKSLPSSSSVEASFSSHTVPLSSSSSTSSISGSQAYKSTDQRPGINLNFLPPVDEGLFTLLQDANLFCSTKAYAAAVSSLCTALQVWL